MSTEEKRVWGIHTKDDNLFLNKSVIAIGWGKMGDISNLGSDREAYKKKYAETYPEAKKGNIASGAGMVYRFCNEVQIGDYVVFPSKSNRQINIGIIESDCFFDSSQPLYPRMRKVKWVRNLPRTAFSQGSLYEVGSALTFFSVKNYSDEFLSAIDAGFKVNSDPDAEDETVGATAEEIKDSTRDFILKELSRHLKGYDLEGFVANLLQAMGYRTTVSKHGGDSGIDIIAYKDELPPRILVQVKSQDGEIREATIQSLKGTMKEGDYGLFVTLSDYTKNAKAYLDNTPIIRAINGTELVDLILKYYEDLDEKYQRIIPLEKVYIPVSREE